MLLLGGLPIGAPIAHYGPVRDEHPRGDPPGHRGLPGRPARHHPRRPARTRGASREPILRSPRPGRRRHAEQRRLRGLPAHRRPMGAPADVHVVRPRRLLRQLTEPTRHRPLPHRSTTRSSSPTNQARTGGTATSTTSPSPSTAHRRSPTHERRTRHRAPRRRDAGAPQIARSAVVIGTARLGEGSLLAEGAVIRLRRSGVEIGTGSAVLENSVVVGNPTIPTTIGRRTVFGHRCLVDRRNRRRPVRDRQRLRSSCPAPGSATACSSARAPSCRPG